MKKKALLLLSLTMVSGCLFSGCGGEKNQNATEALESFTENTGADATQTSSSSIQFQADTADNEIYDFGYLASDYVSFGNYNSIKIEKTEVEDVSEDEVQEEIKNRMKKQEIWSDKTEGTVNRYDLVNLDISCSVDGQKYPAASRKDTNLSVGSGNFFQEFEEQIIGKQIGETVKFTLALADTTQFSDKAGKNAEFTAHIKAVRTQPKLTDEIAARLSGQQYDNAADYEAYIKGILTEEKQEEHNYEVFMEVMGQISDSIEIKGIPEEETADGITNEDIQKEAEEKGVSASELAKQYLDEGKTIASADTGKASMNLLLLSIAEQRGIAVSGSDISAYGTYLLDKGYTEKEIKETYTERDLAHLALNRMVMMAVAESAES